MAFIAAPVATWAMGAATAVGATAATAATVGAVAGAVAVGVATGAVVGAASAAISGGDILKGALKGAAYGGLAGGLASGIGVATGLSSSANQLSSFGVGADTATKAATASDLGSIGTEVEKGSGILSTQTPVSNSVSTPANETPKSTGWFDNISDSKAKVLAGVAEGSMKGLGQVGASMMEAENQKELAETQSAERKEKIAANTPSQFKAQTATIKIPDWWDKYIDTSLTGAAKV